MKKENTVPPDAALKEVAGPSKCTYIAFISRKIEAARLDQREGRWSTASAVEARFAADRNKLLIKGG